MQSFETSKVSWPLASNGYGSIPINTIFSGMNIHLPAILMFTRGTIGFDPLPNESQNPFQDSLKAVGILRCGRTLNMAELSTANVDCWRTIGAANRVDTETAMCPENMV